MSKVEPWLYATLHRLHRYGFFSKSAALIDGQVDGQVEVGTAIVAKREGDGEEEQEVGVGVEEGVEEVSVQEVGIIGADKPPSC